MSIISTLTNGDEFSDETGLKNEFVKQEMNVLFYIAEALEAWNHIETIHEWSQIDLFFLYKLKKLSSLKKNSSKHPFDQECTTKSKENRLFR